MKKNATVVLLLILLIITVQNVAINVYAAGNDDSNKKEVGAWGINNYSGNPNFPSLIYMVSDATGFYGWLTQKGFTGRFLKTDNYASERHFEKASIGGQDSSYADACDFVYFAGHGTYDAFHFGTSNDNNAYPKQVHYTEADWGDQDLEWISLLLVTYSKNIQQSGIQHSIIPKHYTA